MTGERHAAASSSTISTYGAVRQQISLASRRGDLLAPLELPRG
jgi:hypothetical protein